jgi:hypothetical protein
MLTKAKTLQVQNAALRAYHKYHGNEWNDIETEEQLVLGEGNAEDMGDTLALFLWREMGDAGGDFEEATRMLHTIEGEVLAVMSAMEDEWAAERGEKKVEKGT